MPFVNYYLHTCYTVMMRLCAIDLKMLILLLLLQEASVEEECQFFLFWSPSWNCPSLWPSNSNCNAYPVEGVGLVVEAHSLVHTNHSTKSNAWLKHHLLAGSRPSIRSIGHCDAYNSCNAELVNVRCRLLSGVLSLGDRLRLTETLLDNFPLGEAVLLHLG